VIRRLLVLCVTLVCCLALTSCGGDDEAKADNLGIPAYARTNDEKGAQGFARYWVDTLNKATTSGDTKQLRKISQKSCTTCTDFADQLDKIYADGGHVETDGFEVKKMANEANIPPPGAGVSVILTATPQTVVASEGAKPRELKGGDVRFRFIMLREGEHWEMDRMDVG
jgi:hypothetical protein